ncbi:hypothetical protein DPMN_181349 [Dreissena polymorpha]|uniref:Uncharacterized protein n=1 Tax=Dreissena polymorpha TaxID=45954 RepID=A0A9D4DDM5_DREPO|nr:hypothetical protein DPMN_181349 [Dreissena polymorpha]
MRKAVFLIHFLYNNYVPFHAQVVRAFAYGTGGGNFDPLMGKFLYGWSPNEQLVKPECTYCPTAKRTITGYEIEVKIFIG